MRQKKVKQAVVPQETHRHRHAKTPGRLQRFVTCLLNSVLAPLVVGLPLQTIQASRPPPEHPSQPSRSEPSPALSPAARKPVLTVQHGTTPRGATEDRVVASFVPKP